MLTSLTKKYRVGKTNIGSSGGALSDCTHFEKVHKILDGLRVHDNDVKLLNNFDYMQYVDDPILFDPECASTSRTAEPPPTKRAKIYAQPEIIEIARERLELQREQGRGEKQELGKNGQGV